MLGSDHFEEYKKRKREECQSRERNCSSPSLLLGKNDEKPESSDPPSPTDRFIVHAYQPPLRLPSFLELVNSIQPITKKRNKFSERLSEAEIISSGVIQSPAYGGFGTSVSAVKEDEPEATSVSISAK